MVGWGVAWTVAAVLAVVIGVVAVSSVGASIRGRGPLGDNEAIRQAELSDRSPSTVAPTEAAERREIAEEFGVLVVECRGTLAYGVEARPDAAAGWRVVSYERGPDDDVDAVFANRGRSIDIEVFCNRGVPTVAEVELNELPED